MQKEKEKLFKLRSTVRGQADKEKMKLMSMVENMKKRGNFDKSELSKLGINVKSDEGNSPPRNRER